MISKMRPASRGLLVVVAMVLLGHACQAGVVQEVAQQRYEMDQFEEPLVARRRPVFYSELKLRSVVEMTNLELRQLKRDFMQQMTDIYLQLKVDPLIGYERARDYQEENFASSANVLIAEEFATLAIKKHVIQRRLFTGLKLAFTKFLPMQTLVHLYRHYPKTFGWLSDQEQVDLRAKFPGAAENQFVILYTLIELRARVRAADDVLALTSDHIRRVLQIVHWYLVESNHGRNDVTADELRALARNAKMVLQFYAREVLQWHHNLHKEYEIYLKNARSLVRILNAKNPQRGQVQLVEFIDRIINVEALDIDLNAQAQSLEVPPTISEQMILNVQARWIPWYVLKSLEEDRRLLANNRKRVMHLVRLDPVKFKQELHEWVANMLDYICRNDVMQYGGGGGGGGGSRW